jgi:hypothetical protein
MPLMIKCLRENILGSLWRQLCNATPGRPGRKDCYTSWGSFVTKVGAFALLEACSESMRFPVWQQLCNALLGVLAELLPLGSFVCDLKVGHSLARTA